MAEAADKPEEPPRTQPGVSEHDARVQMAAERTLLAWVRTGLALMAFGFVVAKFALIMASFGVRIDSLAADKANLIGVLLVVLGVFSSAGAPFHYRKYFARIRRGGTRPFAAWTLVMLVAYSTAIIGIALAIYLLMLDFSAPQLPS